MIHFHNHFTIFTIFSKHFPILGIIQILEMLKYLYLFTKEFLFYDTFQSNCIPHLSAARRK